MKFEWDFSEFEEFANRLNEMDRFEKFAERALKEISKALLRLMKLHTPVESYELINGWDDASQIVVTKTKSGYKVLLMNKTPYARWVNDGHKAYNQYGGPYEIHNRVKIKSPYKWQEGDETWYVFGHFFVERGIDQLKSSKKIEDLICVQLQKWWSECLSG